MTIVEGISGSIHGYEGDVAIVRGSMTKALDTDLRDYLYEGFLVLLIPN